MNRRDLRLATHGGTGVDIGARCAGDERGDQLSGRLLSAQEDERRRIAHELHDNLSQRVALLAIEISQMSTTWSRTPMAVGDAIRTLALHTAEIATELHDLSHRLHSSRLEVLGLVAAVRGLCREFVARGIAVDFVDQNVPASVSYDVTLCLFRIVQEGLNNVVKHSGVHEARVKLTGNAGTLTLSIVDGGRGFDPAQCAVSHEGLGLASMRERLRSIGGQVVICSKPGRGTTIEARVSLASGRSVATSGAPQRRIRETDVAAADALPGAGGSGGLETPHFDRPVLTQLTGQRSS